MDPLRAGLGKGRGCHLWRQNRHFPSRAPSLTQGLCPLWWKAAWFGAVCMVTRPRPSLAVSVPGPPPLGPELSRPGPGPVGSGFLVDLQPLQPHSSPCHPVSRYIQSLIILVIFPSVLAELMRKANRNLGKCGNFLLARLQTMPRFGGLELPL